MMDITRKDMHLYELVANDLKKKMQENFFGKDQRIPNYLELTDMYDVSMSTIRRAMKILNDEEVLISRVGKGTYATKKFLNGSEIRPGIQTGKIGLMIRDIEGPYFSAIYRALADLADESKRKLMLTVSRDIHQQEDSLLRMLVAHQSDGLLLTTRRKSIFGIRIYEMLEEKKIPSVLLHDVYDSKFPIVDVDNHRGGQLAAEHLLKRVKRNFCVVVGENGFRPDDMRLEGFMTTLQDAGIDTSERCMVYRYSFGTENTAFDEGYKIGKSLAIKNLEIDGIFLFNDLIAMGFQKAILERGFRIPEDIAIIGFDNIERCSEARVSLTTIEVPRYEIGNKAFTILKELIENQGSLEPTRTLLEPRLIQRESA